MSESSVTTTPVHRWWIDALLAGGGVAAFAAGWNPAAAALVALGLTMPLLHAIGVRGRTVDRSLPFAPDELAAAHARVRSAAARLGRSDPDARDALDIADDVVLEAAAIFAGREVRGATHRRYVRRRTALLDRLAADTLDRANALTAARAEVDLLSPDVLPEVQPTASDPLATALLWILAPTFVVWEVVAGIVRMLVSLVDGIVLRLRTAARLLVRGVLASGRAIAAATRRWREVRERFVASWREARRQFLTVRLRLRLRLHRARRAA